MNTPIKLKNLLPGLYESLKNALLANKECELADKLDAVNIYFLCDCERDMCCSFWTSDEFDDPRDEAGHKSIWLEVMGDDCILDVVDDKIIYIEISAFISSVANKLMETALPKKHYFVR